MWRKYSNIDKSFYQNYYDKLHKKLFSSRKFVFRYYLPTLDLLNIVFRPSLWHLHRKLYKHLEDQKRHWKKSYTSNYFYQGLSEIGITGVKPTETRFERYQIDHLLDKKYSVLDIGSNCGFVAVYLSRLVNNIDTVELNPYLNRISRDVLDHLNISNVSIHECDFTHFETNQKYDAIFSFSNHHTIDGNFYMSFQDYVRKLADMTWSGGYPYKRKSWAT